MRLDYARLGIAESPAFAFLWFELFPAQGFVV